MIILTFELKDLWAFLAFNDYLRASLKYFLALLIVLGATVCDLGLKNAV